MVGIVNQYTRSLSTSLHQYLLCTTCSYSILVFGHHHPNSQNALSHPVVISRQAQSYSLLGTCHVILVATCSVHPHDFSAHSFRLPIIPLLQCLLSCTDACLVPTFDSLVDFGHLTHSMHHCLIMSATITRISISKLFPPFG